MKVYPEHLVFDVADPNPPTGEQLHRLAASLAYTAKLTGCMKKRQHAKDTEIPTAHYMLPRQEDSLVGGDEVSVTEVCRRYTGRIARRGFTGWSMRIAGIFITNVPGYDEVPVLFGGSGPSSRATTDGLRQSEVNGLRTSYIFEWDRFGGVQRALRRDMAIPSPSEQPSLVDNLEMFDHQDINRETMTLGISSELSCVTGGDVEMLRRDIQEYAGQLVAEKNYKR